MSIENKNDNFTKPALAAVISMLWIMWFSTVGLLSEICHGDYFWQRTLFMIPFTCVSFLLAGVFGAITADIYWRSSRARNCIRITNI